MLVDVALEGVQARRVGALRGLELQEEVVEPLLPRQSHGIPVAVLVLRVGVAVRAVLALHKLLVALACRLRLGKVGATLPLAARRRPVARIHVELALKLPKQRRHAVALGLEVQTHPLHCGSPLLQCLEPPLPLPALALAGAVGVACLGGTEQPQGHVVHLALAPLALGEVRLERRPHVVLLRRLRVEGVAVQQQEEILVAIAVHLKLVQSLLKVSPLLIAAEQPVQHHQVLLGLQLAVPALRAQVARQLLVSKPRAPLPPRRAARVLNDVDEDLEDSVDLVVIGRPLAAQPFVGLAGAVLKEQRIHVPVRLHPLVLGVGVELLLEPLVPGFVDRFVAVHFKGYERRLSNASRAM